MKKNNLNIVKIDKNKSLFNYEKKILINELILDLKLGYYDFEKKKVEDLSKVGREYNDFPVLVIRINKVAGKSYNSVNILLVESLSGTPPEPEYMSIGISTNSGSKFATKFEVNTTTKNWRGAR